MDEHVISYVKVSAENVRFVSKWNVNNTNIKKPASVHRSDKTTAKCGFGLETAPGHPSHSFNLEISTRSLQESWNLIRKIELLGSNSREGFKRFGPETTI